MTGVLEKEGYIHGFVRCGDRLAIGDTHWGIVVENWGDKLRHTSSVEQTREDLLEMFGEPNIDMGLIVRRGGKILEVGGFSSSFFIPSWELVEQIRPETIEKIRVLYPEMKVRENEKLRR